MAPKPSSTDDKAVAANAPSTIGDHSMKRQPLSFRVRGALLSIDISMASTQAKEGQALRELRR